MNEEILFETELVPDPDEDHEMGAQIPQFIGDQDLNPGWPAWCSRRRAV